MLSKNSSFSSILLNDSELNISKFCSYADNVCSLRFGNSQSHPLNGSVGFNECIRATYLCLLKDDSARFSTYLSLARRAVSQQINKFVGRESILNGVSAFAMQLNCINETEDLGSTLFGDVPYRDILKKWGANLSETRNMPSDEMDSFRGLDYKNLNCSFKEIEFAMATREISLRIICSKYGKNSEGGEALTNHLWEMCYISRQVR